jgi:hypothetical protein
MLLSWIKTLLGWSRANPVSLNGARERVERGASFLDDADPGWYRRVDAASLELEHGTSCVLGQLHGDFRLGLGRADLINLSSAPRASLSPSAHGFQCVQNVSDEDQARDYEHLTQAWTEAIETRIERDASGDGHAGSVPPELVAEATDLTS